MKRTLLETLWIGAVAASVAVGLQMSGLLARPGSALARALGRVSTEPVGFGYLCFVILLSFAVAWVMLVVTGVARRAILLILLLGELIGVGWLLPSVHFSFPPLPAIIAVAVAAILVFSVGATRANRTRRAIMHGFAGRLAQDGIDRLVASDSSDFAEPRTHDASFVFCEIANEAELIEELSASSYAQLTREFVDCARESFLREGGYLHAADGEGIRILFGIPNASSRHAVEAARAALAFHAGFRTAAAARPESLGKIDLRIGIGSGKAVASLMGKDGECQVMIAGEPFDLARRLAEANLVYGSEILLDPLTFRVARDEIVARPIDFLTGAESHERLEVYELLALAEKATDEEIARRDRFWTGIVYFREQRWNEALAEFNHARSNNGVIDGPLEWYLRRLEPLCLRVASEPAPALKPLAPLW